MRREEREVTDSKIIEKVLKKAHICRIAFNDDPSPYIVPMNYGYHDGALWFHSATEGKKIDLIYKKPVVSFEIEDVCKLIKGETPCDWTTGYRSLTGYGKIEILTTEEEKRSGLDIIMLQHGRRGVNIYNSEHLKGMVILRLFIEHISCKQSHHHRN